MTDALCEYLEWDSTFFGHRIARARGHRSSAEHADALLQWCAENEIECLYFLADSDDAETVKAVEARGFAFVDIRMTLARSGGAPPPVTGIRASRPEDVAALQAMSGINHTDSRFYYDGHFSRARCDALYETWIARSCTGYADAVLVAERDGAPAGYVSCHLAKEPGAGRPGGSIGLLGVAATAQGAGLGGALIDGALEWFAARGVTSVEVVTQGRNVRAQRAYQRRGFVSTNVQLWYHRWFAAP